MFTHWFNKSKIPKAQALEAFNTARMPAAQSSIEQCPVLVLDVETTGLNPRVDHIISIGWLPLQQRQIIVAESRHYLIQSPVSVGQSATVHGLLDRDLLNARTIGEVLTELLEQYTGYIFAAHHAQLEKSFLQQALQDNLGGKAALKFLDTMAIERHRLQQHNQEATAESLRLGNCLRRYGIKNPAGEHHALEDAYSCALLLLAQTSRTRFSLADLLRQSRA